VTFTLLPAVDVAGGLAVRPTQRTLGEAPTGTDPLTAARRWQAAGAEWIHLVDLDAAFGIGSNADLLGTVIGELDVRIQRSGGIVDEASLERAFESGCDRVVLATQALVDMEWCVAAIAAHPDRIAVALDVRIETAADGAVEHRLSPRGRSTDVGELWHVLAQLDQAGCQRYVVTDVTRDGMLTGSNLELYRSVTAATTAHVIASGGISAIADLVALADLAETAPNLEGAIVGKALYIERFTLSEAPMAVRLT